MQQTFSTSSAEETQQLAASLADNLAPGCVVALHGTLGAGKTCFVKGLAAALGICIPVTSPTFTVINEYRGRIPLYHIDLYRLSGPDEALALGLEEYLFGDGVTAIEWPDRAEELLPAASTLHVTLTRTSDTGDERRIQIACPAALTVVIPR